MNEYQKLLAYSMHLDQRSPEWRAVQRELQAMRKRISEAK